MLSLMAPPPQPSPIKGGGGRCVFSIDMKQSHAYMQGDGAVQHPAPFDFNRTKQRSISHLVLGVSLLDKASRLKAPWWSSSSK
jgi:hypothetical protein